MNDKIFYGDVVNTADHSSPNQSIANRVRNHQIGLWAACMVGVESENAEDYAGEIIVMRLQRGGNRTIKVKLIENFCRGEMRVSSALIREMAHSTLSAERDLRREANLPQLAQPR